MPMNDEMKLRLSVEGGTQGAKELEKVTTAVDGTEKAVRKLGTSAKPGATPYDAVAIAAERAANRVQAVNQAITTSTQEILKAGPSTAPAAPAAEQPDAAPAGGIRWAALAGGATFFGRALADVITIQAKAAEETRQMDHAAETLQNRFAQGLHFAGLQELPGLINATIGQIGGLQDKIFELTNHNITVGEAIGSWISGAESAHEKAARFAEQESQMRVNIGQAIHKEAELGAQTVEIARMRAEGRNREADAAERQMKLDAQIADIRQRSAQGIGTGQDRVKLEATARETATLATAAAEKKLAEEQAKTTTQMQQQAALAELEAHGRSEAASAMKDSITLGERLLEIQSQLTRGIIDEETARQRSAAAAATFAASAEARRRADANKDAAAKKQAIDDKEKLDEQQAQKAEREAERRAKLDEQFAKEKTDGEFNVRIAQARARGEGEMVQRLTEEKALADKIAGINRELTDEQKAELKALYEKEAALGRIETLTKKAVDAANAEIAQREKNGDQLREERTAKLTRESKKRGQVSRNLDAKDAASREAGERQMTPAEREEERKRQFKEMGLDEHGREPKPKAAKDLFAERNKARGDGEWDGTQEDLDNLTGGPGDKTGMMSEKDIAGDAPVEVDAAPVAQAVEQAGQGMATSIVEQISSAIAGVQASVQIDTGSVVSAVNSAISAVRSELQAQIDKLASDINSNG